MAEAESRKTAKNLIPVSYHVFLLADEDFAFLTTPWPTNGLVDRVDQVWPELSGDDVVFKATDRYGTQLRHFRGNRS